MTFPSPGLHIASSHDGRGSRGPRTTVRRANVSADNSLKHERAMGADLFGLEEILCVRHEHLLYAHI